MRLLLDTHVVLWALVDDPRLEPVARALILDPRIDVWVSAASIWEIAIKHSLGRGEMPISGREAVGYCRRAGYRWLDVTPEHAAMVETLPPLHADPFDRLLLAQARVEPMHLLTRDAAMVGYGPEVLRI